MKKSVPTSSLGVWLLAVSVWLALSPFELRTSGPPDYVWFPRIDFGVLGHLVLLLPFAAWLGVVAHARRWRRPFLVPWAVVTGLAVVLEVGQLWIDGRTFAPHDIVAGVVGGALVIVGARIALQKGIGWDRALGLVGIATFLAVAGAVVVGGTFPDRDFRLARWDPWHVVLVGQEGDGSRTYLGDISGARICAGGSPERRCVRPGAGPAEREALVRMLHETQELTVSARVRSAVADQEGPARIVTFSESFYQRNMTLAQRDTDLILRLRTPWTGADGRDRQFLLPDAVPVGIPTRVEARFSGGEVTLVAETEGRRVAGTYPAGSEGSILEIREGPGAVGKPYLLSRGAVVGAGLVFMGLGLGTAWGLRARRRLRWVAGPVAAMAGLWIRDCLVMGQNVTAMGEALFAGGTALAGVGLVVLELLRRRSPGPQTRP